MNGDTTVTSSLWRPIQILPMEIIEYTVTIFVVLGGSLCVLGWLMNATGSPLLSLLSWGAGIALSAGYAGFHPHIRTLLRLQARMLLWTWTIPLILIAFALYVGRPMLFSGPFWVFVLMSWLSGALLFGAEYVEGANGYIQTRPVSANSVLYCKLVILLSQILINIVIFTSVGRAPELFRTPFSLLLFGSIAVASAAFTVIFGDIVRGLLASGVIVVGGYFVSINFMIVRRLLTDPVIYPEEVSKMDFPPLGPLVLFSLIFTTFLVLLALLIAAFHSRWSCRLRLPVMAILSLVFSFVGINTLIACCWFDGDYSGTYLLAKSPKGWQIQGNQLSWIGFTDHESFKINHLDLDDPEAIPTTSVIAPISFNWLNSVVYCENNVVITTASPSNPMQTGMGIPMVDPSNPRIPIMEPYERKFDPDRVMAYRISGANPPELLLSQPVLNVNCRPASHEILYEMQDHSWGKFEWCSGNITSLTGEPGPFEPTDSHFRDTLRAGVWNPTDATDGEWSAALITPVEEPLKNMDSYKGPVMGREISLVNLAPDSSRDETRLEIPNRFFNTPYRGLKSLCSFGFHSSLVDHTILRQSRSFFLTLGGGFLCLWHGEIGRVAVWRITDPRAPEFVGIAPTPIHGDNLAAGLVESDLPPIFRNAAPYVRSDGALGYLLPNTGIIWLEFPALMKEAKS